MPVALCSFELLLSQRTSATVGGPCGTDSDPHLPPNPPSPSRLCLDSFLQTATPSTIPFFTPLGIKTTTKDFSSHARLKDTNSILNLDWLHLFWFLSGHVDSGKWTCQPQNDSKSYFYDSKSPVSQLERGSCAK